MKMILDFVEAPLPLFKFGGGLAETSTSFCFWWFWRSWSLSFLLEEGGFGQRFLELRLQPLHRNGVTLFHPLESGL
jgi:hypothetical protein